MKGLTVYVHPTNVLYMNTYRVTLVDTNSNWHTITVLRDGWRGVKTEARKIAKSRGIQVKFINDFYVAG